MQQPWLYPMMKGIFLGNPIKLIDLFEPAFLAFAAEGDIDPCHS
jgi:hypothetical protein